MAVRKAKEDEKIDAVNLERVIKLLEPTEVGVKAVTKKDACAMLNISYNTSRLNTLIEKFKEKKLRDAERRAALRGKPVTPEDIKYVISEYMQGMAVSNISESCYRSVDFIKRILEDNAVPIRQMGHDYRYPQLIPEEAVRERFSVGEVVYSARYDSTAKIEGELNQQNRWVYRIWLLSEKYKEFAYQEACELASLSHLVKLGVKF